MRRPLARLCAAALILAAAPAAAQDPVAELLRGEAGVADRTPAPDPEAERVTAALNAEIVAQNELAAEAEKAALQAVIASDAARMEAHARAVAEAEAQREAEMAAHVAAVARQRADYERRMALWREVSEACRRNETERCRVGRLALEAAERAAHTQP
jgi:Skp family chaperone for outer membrane proteins